MDTPAVAAKTYVDYPLRFTGSGSEFFRIWIVNTLLTVLTLYIYSAWAKVRTQRYFYANTLLDGVGFGYHATPIQILKGRLILAAGFVLYLGVSYLWPGAESIVFLLVLLVVPWLLVRSLAFRLRNTSYRNLRFAFTGTVDKAYWVFLKGGVATSLTAGLAYFWLDWLRSCFAINHMYYGRSAFTTRVRVKDFFLIYLAVVGVALGLFMLLALFVLPAITTLVEPYIAANVEPDEGQAEIIGLLVMALFALFFSPLGLFLFTFLQVKKFNAIANALAMGEAGHRLRSELGVGRLFFIYFTNMLLILLTLGLFIPWAKVRVARYRLHAITLLAAGSLDDAVARETEELAATGEEIGDYVDLDLGF